MYVLLLFYLKAEEFGYDYNLYVAASPSSVFSSLPLESSIHALGTPSQAQYGCLWFRKGPCTINYLWTAKFTGGIWNWEGGAGKHVFLDSLWGARKKHWRGMADQLIPNPRKAPAEGKSYCGTSGVPLFDAEVINTPHSLARRKWLANDREEGNLSGIFQQMGRKYFNLACLSCLLHPVFLPSYFCFPFPRLWAQQSGEV